MKTLRSLGLRTKIILTLLPTALPMLVVTGTMYMDAKENSIRSSAGTTALVSKNASNQLNGYLERQGKVFAGWTAQDIYGLSIEFETTEELGSQFEQMLGANPAFSMLGLADTDGKLILARAKHGQHDALVGTSLPTLPAPNESGIGMGLIGNWVQQFDAHENIVLTFACKDSGGDQNGSLIAILDWDLIDRYVEDANSTLNNQGFSSAISMIVRSGSNEPLAIAGDEGSSDQLNAGSFSGMSWWGEFGTTAFSADTPELGAVNYYAKSSPLIQPEWAFIGLPDDLAVSSLRFVTLVAEGDVLKEANQSLRVALLLSGIGTAVMFSLLWICGTRIAKPIKITASALQDIAEGEGDLTKTIELNRHDEIGELAHWFNRFVTNIREVIVQVQQASNDVTQTAERISGSSSQMADLMGEQSNQAILISSAAEQMSSSIQQTAQNCQDVASGANEGGKVARHGSEVVERTVTEIGLINDSIKSLESIIGELGKRGEEIGQVIQVINEIAEQTNLLALNAAIEAARAGEHGRGFAVVADEVRKLADRTTQATDEVSDSISAIQRVADQAVENIQDGAERVARGVESVHEAGHQLVSIVNVTNDVASKVDSIAQVTREQQTAGESISIGITDITRLSGETSEEAREAALAAEELTVKARDLMSTVGQFKV